ncbi:hypothetical protein Cni_G09913 [Canna indica]|uniref:Uncharacterized protein n=1 Tax=Canna indica TaxID=4628 RepID=A0AAQ3Q847_9LILI|nr:hypothetical protein Cni_G09913 [Canna indica]
MSEYEAQIKSLNEKWAMFNQLLQQQPRTFGAPPQLGLTSIIYQANLFHSHLGFSQYANVPQYANMSRYSNVPEIASQGGNARDSFSTYRDHEKGKEKVVVVVVVEEEEEEEKEEEEEE